MSKPRLAFFAALLVGAVALGLYLLWPSDDESAARAAVVQVLEGARAADIGATLEPVSETYKDEDGLDKDAIRGMLFLELKRRGPISIQTTPIEIELEGDRATARFDAVLTEDAAGTVLPADADALRVEVELKKEDGEWRITSHSRERLLRPLGG